MTVKPPGASLSRTPVGHVSHASQVRADQRVKENLARRGYGGPNAACF